MTDWIVGDSVGVVEGGRGNLRYHLMGVMDVSTTSDKSVTVKKEL